MVETTPAAETSNEEKNALKKSSLNGRRKPNLWKKKGEVFCGFLGGLRFSTGEGGMKHILFVVRILDESTGDNEMG